MLEKELARTRMRALVRELSPGLRPQADQAITRQLEMLLGAPWWQEFPHSGGGPDSSSTECCGLVAGFVPGGLEPDFLPVLSDHAASTSPPLVGLARTEVQDRIMSLRRWSGSRSDLVRNHLLPVQEPHEKLPVLSLTSPCIVLVPGLAFTPAGHRLGKGGGYYDRFLAEWKTCFRLGIAWEFQMVESLPHDDHDQDMDGILTEKGLRLCPGRRELNKGDDFARLFQYLVEKKPGIDLIQNQGE